MNYDDIAAAKHAHQVRGYLTVYLPGRGHVREHIAIAEVALGRPLPETAVVHHINGITGDNRRKNLVICLDEAYHKGLHVRLRVLRAGGDPFKDRICSYCRMVKPLDQFSPTTRNGKRELARGCKPCVAARTRAWKARQGSEAA